MPLSSGSEQATSDHLGQSMIVVEDEAMVSAMIEMFAVELGWQVVGTAYSEAAALDLIERFDPTVAVMDVYLGSANSCRVADACRAQGIAVLFVTGYTAADLPKECGHDPVLPKPFSVQEFEQALYRCLEGQGLARGVA